MKVLGNLTHTSTSEFQGATFLNDSSVAYDILDSLLGPGGWYPENTDTAWTDIIVLDEKYYAVFGEDSVMAQSADCKYVEIEPTQGMVKEYEYFKQY